MAGLIVSGGNDEEDAHLFQLRWHNYCENILEVFMEQLTSESLVDVTISCEGQTLKAHKIVLSACSPYFKEIFEAHDFPHPVIIMNDILFEDLKHVVEFMYKGEVKVSQKNLSGVLEVAESLQVKGLSAVRHKHEIRQFLNLPVAETADLGNMSDLPVTEEVTQTDQFDINCSAELGDKETVVFDDKTLFLNTNQRDCPKIIGVKVIGTTQTDPDICKFHLPKFKGGTFGSIKTSKIMRNEPIKGQDVSNHNDGSLRRIRRPPNAFMIFASEWRKKLAVQYKSDPNKAISVRLGSMWKELARDAKERYFEAARQADKAHKEMYPNYNYNPMEARQRKLQKWIGKAMPLNSLNWMQGDDSSLRCGGQCKEEDSGGQMPQMKTGSLREVHMAAGKAGKKESAKPVMITVDDPEDRLDPGGPGVKMEPKQEPMEVVEEPCSSPSVAAGGGKA